MGLADKSKGSLYGCETDRDLRRTYYVCTYMLHMIFILFFLNKQRGGGGAGAQTFYFVLLFPVQWTTSGIGHGVEQFVWGWQSIR